MKNKLVVALLLAFFVIGVETAEARYLSYTAAYRAVLLNAIEAKYETTFPDDYSIEIGRRLRLGRVEFPVTLKGDEFFTYVPGSHEPGEPEKPARFIYRHEYCAWNGVAYWHFREIYVKRRDLACEYWVDENRTQ
jgi:hypothetical protein